MNEMLKAHVVSLEGYKGDLVEPVYLTKSWRGSAQNQQVRPRVKVITGSKN